MKALKVQFARPEHAAAIADLHAASWSATYVDDLSPAYLRDIVPGERHAIWQQRFANPQENQFVLVAEDNAELIGFACAFVGADPDLGSYLENLHVHQSHQGRGAGPRLLTEVAAVCEQRCPGQGLYLSVNQSNRRAQQFYLAYGARNARSNIWNAPDGSQVPAFQFVWPSAAALAAAATTRLAGRSNMLPLR